MKIISILSILLFSYSSFAGFSITAPTSVEAEYNVEETTSITITSDQADSMRVIRLIGLSSSDSQDCVKEYEVNESCTFNVSKTVTQPITARIDLRSREVRRTVHTMNYTVAETSTRDDLSEGIEYVYNNQVITSLDLGSLTLESIAAARIYVRNTGGQTTSALESMASNYTGSTSFSLVRDNCQGKELESREVCYFDIRFFPESATSGLNSGTFSVKSSESSASTDLPVQVDLTIPSQGGGEEGGGPLTVDPSTLTIASSGDTAFEASGGTPPYFYSLESTIGSNVQNSGAYQAGANNTGEPVIEIITVFDSADNSTTITVTVSAAGGGGEGGGPLAISPTAVTLESGDSITLVASGGTPGYFFVLGSSTIESSVNTSSGLYTAGINNTGEPVVELVSVLDGNDASATATITVLPAGEGGGEGGGGGGPLTVSPSAPTVPSGGSVGFEASGGTGPYFYGFPDNTPVLPGSTINSQSTGSVTFGVNNTGEPVVEVITLFDSADNALTINVTVLPAE